MIRLFRRRKPLDPRRLGQVRLGRRTVYHEAHERGIGLGLRSVVGGFEYGCRDTRTGTVMVCPSQAAAHAQPYMQYPSTPFDTVMRKVDQNGEPLTEWIIDYVPDP
jgi:hypothetical protein